LLTNIKDYFAKVLRGRGAAFLGSEQRRKQLYLGLGVCLL
jgi:hypothetical protein